MEQVKVLNASMVLEDIAISLPAGVTECGVREYEGEIIGDNLYLTCNGQRFRVFVQQCGLFER